MNWVNQNMLLLNKEFNRPTSVMKVYFEHRFKLKKLRKLYNDIKILKKGEISSPDIKSLGGHAYMWEPLEDKGWQEYLKARNEVPQWIQKLLVRIKYLRY